MSSSSSTEEGGRSEDDERVRDMTLLTRRLDERLFRRFGIRVDRVVQTDNTCMYMRDGSHTFRVFHSVDNIFQVVDDEAGPRLSAINAFGASAECTSLSSLIRFMNFPDRRMSDSLVSFPNTAASSASSTIPSGDDED